MFLDLFNLSTFLIPREYHPPLTSHMKQLLSILGVRGGGQILSAVQHWVETHQGEKPQENGKLGTLEEEKNGEEEPEQAGKEI